jgi:transcriptional regulator with XRE-family HTH domain
VATRLRSAGLQRERKLKGLTLEQLAALSGVSKSMLSQVERGQANPTFAVLWSLTRALRIGFSELLAEATLAREDEAIELVSTAATPEMRGAEGQWRLRILSPPHFAGNTEWYELEIAPGGVLESSPHASGAVEHLTALTPGPRGEVGPVVAIPQARRDGALPSRRSA